MSPGGRRGPVLRARCSLTQPVRSLLGRGPCRVGLRSPECGLAGPPHCAVWTLPGGAAPSARLGLGDASGGCSCQPTAPSEPLLALTPPCCLGSWGLWSPLRPERLSMRGRAQDGGRPGLWTNGDMGRAEGGLVPLSGTRGWPVSMWKGNVMALAGRGHSGSPREASMQRGDALPTWDQLEAWLYHPHPEPVGTG